MNKFIVLFLAAILSIPLFAQDLSTYSGRRQSVISSLKDVTLLQRGKHGLSKAVARLESNPNDQAALTYISSVLEHRYQSMFDFPGVALALCRYWDSFNVEQRNQIQSQLERLAKSDKIDGQGFLLHGTENHATMMWTSAFLFAQLFPDAQWVNGMTSQELMDDMKERLRRTFRNVYQKGYAEYLSSTYEVVMNFPVEILLEYAKDPEMKAIAEAFLLYKWSLISLNNFEGNIMAPYARMFIQEDHAPGKDPVSATSYYNWLMWGWGPATNNVNITDFTDHQETNYALFSALSHVKPDDVFFRLADSKNYPFTLKSSASTFGEYGTGVPHMVMRKIYRDKSYAIGTGNFRWVPGFDYADDNYNGFNIVWSSPDKFNYIGCFHPYWYSDSDDPTLTPDTWDKGNISPFQQTAQHENTAIVLFNIPDKDPYPNAPDPRKWAWRDGHTDQLLQRAMLRYPKSVDEKINEQGWIFLREGKTYIGIKPLKSFYEQTDLTGIGRDYFNIVKSDHAKTGFVFELGTEEEFGSFKKFRSRLLKNKLSVDWQQMKVNYTNSRKDQVEIRYQPGLPVVPYSPLPASLEKKGIKGMAESVPVVRINGRQEIPYEQWPMIESPYVTMNNNLLVIDDGQSKITVDWTGDYPVIRRNEQGSESYFTDFPAGYTPEEVGKKLGYHFIPGEHFLHGGKWIHYAEVCTWYGALRFAEATGDKTLISQLQERFEPLFTTEKQYQPIMNHVDLNMFGCLPLEFYKVTKDKRYYELGMPYADTQWQVPSDATKDEKGWADKGLSWQTRMWIDDMFMITIIQAQAYHVTGDQKYIDRAAREMVVYLDELQRSNGLFYHAPDVPFFWGRGNGWMAAGMTELLLSTPKDNPDRPRILEGYRLMMKSLKDFQSKNGMWNQLIDKPDCWAETSGTAMFTYAMIMGVKNGWLDAETYGPVARAAWMALIPYIDANGDVTEVCVGTNKKNDLQYYYDRPRIAGDYHGQAPLLWCAYALLY